MTPRETWTDARLDEFKKSVSERFDRIDADIRELRKTMIQGFFALVGIMATGFLTLVGLAIF